MPRTRTSSSTGSSICPSPGEVDRNAYSWLDLPNGNRRRMTTAERDGSESLPDGARVFRWDNLTSRPAWTRAVPRSTNSTAKSTARAAGLEDQRWRAWPAFSSSAGSSPRAPRSTTCATSTTSMAYPIYERVGRHCHKRLRADKRYVVQTNTKVITRCVLMTTDPGDLVIDPTCGSGTTATSVSNSVAAGSRLIRRGSPSPSLANVF